MWGFSISIKDCMDQHIARAQASVSERTSAVVELLRDVNARLENIVSCFSIPYYSLIYFNCSALSRDVLLLHSIDAPPYGSSLALPASGEIQVQLCNQ